MPKETKPESELRYKWREFAVVDDSFEDASISLNADRIADWWLSQRKKYLEAIMESVERLKYKTMEDKFQLIKFVSHNDTEMRGYNRAIEDVIKKINQT